PSERAHGGRLLPAGGRRPEIPAPRDPPGDPQIAYFYWQPGVTMASATEHEPGGSWVQPSQLLARATLAGDRLASVVGVSAGRRTPARRARARVIPRTDHRRRVGRVLRALRRRAARVHRAVLDRCRGPRLAGEWAAAGA